jgi:DNA-binding HxlR family transcriptional regulator
MKNSEVGEFVDPDDSPDADHEAMLAVIQRVLGMIGGKWKSLILFHIAASTVCRFGELRKKLPEVTQKMLTSALRELEHDGLVSRRVYAEVPPRVEYELTPLGGTLIELAMALADWAIENHPRIEDSRAAYDAAHPS